jgi:cyanophycinase
VIPSFEDVPKWSGKLLQPWHELGLKSVQILHTTSRDEANRAEFVRPIEEATGVWLSGGTQAWLSRHYAGTLVEEKLQALIERGGVVGGSSAGAAAMTKVMIEQGQEEAVAGVGFDLFRGAVIDQHFLRRSRLNRLMGLMESHPNRIAFGIDEGTALVVQIPHGRLGVIGSSYVMAYVPETESGEQRFEALKRGDQIDLRGLKSGRVRVSSRNDLDAVLNDE